MKSRHQFLAAVAQEQGTSQADIAVALLWFYKQTQEYEERTAAELADDMHDESLSRPNVTRLEQALKDSRQTIKGKRSKTFQLNLKGRAALDSKYMPVLGVSTVAAHGDIIPNDVTAKTRPYIERLAQQINVCYETGLYDGCGVLCRRLMESLLIEVYIHRSRHHEIQRNGTFKGLDEIIDHIAADTSITLTRGSSKVMKDVKTVGDTAAHHRTYITSQLDIDDVKAPYRRVIVELLTLAGIK